MHYSQVRKVLIDFLNRILSSSFSQELTLPIPEDSFLQYAGKEGVLSYCYYYLVKQHSVLKLTPATEVKLREYFYMISALNLRINDNLIKFLHQADDEGLSEFVILKGAHLINEIYDNPSVRPMGDVDVLFKKSDFDSMKKILNKLGFKFSRDSSQGYNFNKDDSVMFDLMTFEGDYYIGNLRKKLSPLNYSRVKDYTKDLDINGVSVPVLKPEINLILFADHARKHFYNRLVWFLDFIILFRKSGVKFANLVKLARKLEMEKSLFYFYYLINSFFPNQLPRKDIAISNLEERVLNGIFLGKISRGNSYLYYLSLNSWLDRLYLVFKKLFPSRKEMTFIYRTTNPLYLLILYMFRPIMIISTFINNIIKSKR